ncbi:hypothetical protein [Streptococcus sp. zg-JUN1979]|uniref:hypothetical protein n=1 Tax=Streptococcus sp. zg-JUN1979 TaxID=3391450 RepID=UPI0039A65D41
MKDRIEFMTILMKPTLCQAKLSCQSQTERQELERISRLLLAKLLERRELLEDECEFYRYYQLALTLYLKQKGSFSS